MSEDVPMPGDMSKKVDQVTWYFIGRSFSQKVNKFVPHLKHIWMSTKENCDRQIGFVKFRRPNQPESFVNWQRWILMDNTWNKYIDEGISIEAICLTDWVSDH